MNDHAEEVILIDAQDRPLGTAAKLDAHKRGALHRAFSILIHDGAGNLLLQKRHPDKYHSGGLWTNTCCGHPRPGEDVRAAARRRLKEEMGFTTELTALGTLTYRADVGNGLIEHELVHVFVGRHTGPVSPDEQEAEDWCWRSIDEIRDDAATSPHLFTAWFRRYLRESWPTAHIEETAHGA